MIVLHPACAVSPDRVRAVQQSTGLLAVPRGRLAALINPGEKTMKLIITKRWDGRKIVIDAEDMPDLESDCAPVNLLTKWLELDSDSLELESGDTITIE